MAVGDAQRLHDTVSGTSSVEEAQRILDYLGHYPTSIPEFEAARNAIQGGGGGGGDFTGRGGQPGAPSPEGNIYYPDVQLPNINLPGGGAAGVPTLDWMRFLEARRQYESAMSFQQAQYQSQLQANPRDWIQQWYYNRGQGQAPRGGPQMPPSQGATLPYEGFTPLQEEGLSIPPWLQAISSGESIPNVQGGSSPFASPGGLPTVMPWQTNAVQWGDLSPDEREGAYGYWSSLGFNPASVNQYIQQTRPLASSVPAGGVSRWAF